MISIAGRSKAIQAMGSSVDERVFATRAGAGKSLKRLSERSRRRLLKISRLRASRKLEERQRRLDRRRVARGLTEKRTAASGKPAVHVRAPEHLSLVPQHYVGTMDFLVRVRKVALNDGRRVALDLRGCNLVSAEIALLLAAEIQRIRHLKGGDSVGGMSPTNPVARRTLHGMGFFELLNLRDPLQEPDEAQPVINIASGTALDGQVTKRIADEFAETLGLSSERRELVQKALNEALENISEHAYFDRTKLTYAAEMGRWWICSIAPKEEASAYLLACDLGMTIPATVPETARRGGPTALAALARFLGGAGQDEQARLLAAAFEDEVTRRPDGKGGRGLGKMAQLVQEFPDAHLSVWSGGAIALLGKGDLKVKTYSLPRRFFGTYILWNLSQAAGS